MRPGREGRKIKIAPYAISSALSGLFDDVDHCLHTLAIRDHHRIAATSEEFLIYSMKVIFLERD
jgi:hypothetical protein